VAGVAYTTVSDGCGVEAEPNNMVVCTVSSMPACLLAASKLTGHWNSGEIHETYPDDKASVYAGRV